MKIAIIIGKKIIPEIHALHFALKERGHISTIIQPDETSSREFPTELWVQKLCTYDLVYYRTGFGKANCLLIGQALSSSRTIFINPAHYLYTSCTNKIYQSLIARRQAILVPKSIVDRHVSFPLLGQALGIPFIAKAAEGIQGAKVYLVGNSAELAQFLKLVEGEVLFQQHIPNTGDYRVFVIGEEVFKIYKRIPAEGDFKANMSLGASGEAVTDRELCKNLGAIALSMSKALGIDIGGIDIIASQEDGTLYYLESNINPGWKWLDATLSVNTAEHIVDYFEKRVEGSL